MPMKETGKQSSEGSAPPSEQPGTSRDAVEPAGQNLSCKENSRVTLASQPKKVSYSTELFSTWRDIRWFQIPLSSLRRPKAGLFSFRFQSSLQEYQQLRKTKRLKVGRPFSVLPFPNLSVTLSDCSQEPLYKQHGKHSGTGRVNSCKSSSSCGAGSRGFSRRTCPCSSPACSLSKRFVFCSGDNKLRQKGRTRSRPRKKQQQEADGRSEQGLTPDPPAHSPLLSPVSPAVVMDMTGGGEGTSAWGNANSPLEEEDDMFPADWTPPRIEFLYNDDPPPLSPAPGPASESQSSGEMPDITEEAFGPGVREITPEATFSAQNPLEIFNQDAALEEAEKRDTGGLENLEPSFCPSANEGLEGALLGDQTRAKTWTDFGTACSPLPSPISSSTRISSRNSISVSSPDFAEDPGKLDLELDLTEEVDQGHPPSSYCYHPSMAASRVSSRSSISASSDEFAGDPEKQLLDSDVERDLGRESPPSQLPTPPQLASSKVSIGSSISASSDEFVGDSVTMLDSDAERDPGLESPPSQLPTHPLMMASPTASSRSSISSSSNKLSKEDPGGMTPSLDTEEDMDDSGLISLRDMLRTDDVNQRSVELLSSGSDCYLSSLDKLLEEKREQIREDEELERSLGEKLLLSGSLHSSEAVEENVVTFPEAHRLLLKRFSVSQGAIPAVHPGESIFGPLPDLKTAPALDTTGLMPQNQLESLFFSSQFDQQMVFLQDGFLTFLYRHGKSHCPCPVRRWLFQLMSLNSEVSADAFQALWEITAHQVASNDEVNTDLWFPTLKDITQAFYHLGACVFALYPAGLVHLEFRPKGLEFSEHLLECAKRKSQSLLQEGLGQLTLAAMLGDIFKFLTLCVASQPHGYSDHQRLAFLAVLCRLSLDRSLQKQPLLELQQLLLVLLEGIGDWQEKLLELCKSLCHISEHHHNLVAVMRLFPDTTDRGRQLRRNLSLSFITKLLGKVHMATSPWQEEDQLQKLGHLLPLMKPAFLKQNLQNLQKYQDGNEQQEALAELDREACYLCYSLLTLASVVVGTQAMPLSKQGPLQHLCVQLQQHIGASIREDPSIVYRTELKNLVAQTYVKWQELLSHSWLQVTTCRARVKTSDGTHPRDTALL
ncbi:protein FAM178B isoform X2 [Paroedura picta]|uniref:protein FAM178B isoform X2 n=1 Tax=Paroedura picta TaxID=143630 RepID=UPI0040564D6F